MAVSALTSQCLHSLGRTPGAADEHHAIKQSQENPALPLQDTSRYFNLVKLLTASSLHWAAG